MEIHLLFSTRNKILFEEHPKFSNIKLIEFLSAARGCTHCVLRQLLTSDVWPVSPLCENPLYL